MTFKRKKIAIGAAIACTVIAVASWLFGSSGQASANTAKCESGTFETTVISVGEVQAVKSLDILVPDALSQREIRVQWLKITDMAAEGTMVRKGDYVATLDPADVDSELKRANENSDQLRNSWEEARLDSSLKLSTSRADIRNASDDLIDKKLKVEQSVFESKAYQRQAQIELERTERQVEQKKRNHQKQQRRLELGIERINNDIKQAEKRRQLLLDLQEGLKVKAPADGMLLYAKSWSGSKIRVGDEVGRFMPLIATLPDLSELVSEAFVQEVDIKHIKLGQKVRMTIDAFPEEKFTGKVTAVANIGQKMPGKEMNGFKVTIAIDPTTAKILPGMTTNNNIVTGIWENSLMVPRPAVFGSDSLQYVYVQHAFNVIKQKVNTSGENETYFRISNGLQKGNKVLLVEPHDGPSMPLTE
ncbi:MAG: efflux RND transporter periplasmic adaptor subunit [Breznakibacter sp.]